MACEKFSRRKSFESTHVLRKKGELKLGEDAGIIKNDTEKSRNIRFLVRFPPFNEEEDI